MKHKVVIGLCVIIMIASIFAFAQEEPQKVANTKLEQFLLKKGMLFIKDFHLAGNLHGKYGANITVNALTLYEPGKEKEKIKGLQIEVFKGGMTERSNVSFLDMDEVESLSQALTYMINLRNNWQENDREYTEVVFSTKDSFELGFFQKGTETTAFSKSGIIGVTSCYFPTKDTTGNLDDLLKFKKIIDNGISLLGKE